MRQAGLGAAISTTAVSGQAVTIPNADSGSLLTITFLGLDTTRGLTFSTTGGVSNEIGPNIANISPGTNYTGIFSSPLQLILDGNPGAIKLTWWRTGVGQLTGSIVIPGAAATRVFRPSPFPPLVPPIVRTGGGGGGGGGVFQPPGSRGNPGGVRVTPPTNAGAATTGMSTSTIALIGVAALAVIGGGYLFYKNSRR
jgi:hypothetical protein